LELVAQTGPPRLDQARGGGRLRAPDQPGLAGLLVAGADHQEGVRGRARDAEEEARVLLLVDQHVLAAARGAAEDARGPAFLVAPGPEQPLRTGREGEVAGRALDRAFEGLAAGEVFHPYAVELRALVVLGPGEQRVVGGVAGGRDLEIGVTLRQG